MRAKMFRILLAIEICDSILWALNGSLITASKKKHDASIKIPFSDLKSTRKIIKSELYGRARHFFSKFQMDLKHCVRIFNCINLELYFVVISL